MTEADSVLSTPRIDSSLNSNVVKFPYSVSRLIHSRKPRRSKNGTAEERAAKAAGAAVNEPPRRTSQVRLDRRKMGGDHSLFHTRAAAGIHGRCLETPKPSFPKVMKRRRRSA